IQNYTGSSAKRLELRQLNNSRSKGGFLNMLDSIPRNLEVSKSSELLERLKVDGIVVLPRLVSPEQLASMQRAFALRLKKLRWNDFDGYEQTELYRHMI